ncbi:LamG-like jellyroll fold domain-containing protein [Streptomyces sp. 058-1L]|uniref:LamG-like jellyroll fold domain-containing protein n=1 Tax=Streptomyces sp. 058-1L TaxID=2789266 RepID=UPI00397F3459
MPRSAGTPSPSSGPVTSSGPFGGDMSAASDRELAWTAWQESAATATARELADRHRHALSAYAARCTATSAAAELLCTAAQNAALLSYASVGDTAWRPHLLRTVVRTAADWAAGGMRRHLAPELASWLTESDAAVEAPGEENAEKPLLARSFQQLHERQQIVLWHVYVEQEDLARVALYAGVGQAVARRWSGTAAEELRIVYARLYEESAAPECRPFSRLVVARARTEQVRTAGPEGPDELGGHLGGCGDCSWVFDDLSRLNGEDWPLLLAEALLPWNGGRYRADRTSERTPEQPDSARNAVGSPALSGLQLPALRTRSGKALVAVVAAGAVLGLVLGSVHADPADTSSGANGSFGVDAWGRNTLPASGEKRASPSAPSTPPPSGGSPPDHKASGKSEEVKNRKVRKDATDPQGHRPLPPRSTPPGSTAEQLTPAGLRWDFRNAGTYPVDTSSFGRTGTYHGHVDWRDDRDGSVWFDGDSFVKTSQAVLDTSRSFTVSAWVRPEPAGRPLTVAGQDGNNVSGFFLQYTQDDRWRLAMGHHDSPDADEDEVLSAVSPGTGTWQHLTSVFDAEQREIRLYLDGRLQRAASHTSTWNAGGSFTVGRGLWQGEDADEYQGHIDDVRVFQRAVSASQAAALADAGPNS